MNCNQTGIDLLKEFEGCRLESYPDPGTGGDPWTVAWGHTGPDVTEGMTISQERADDLLEQDVKRFEIAVKQCVSVPLTENQFSALVCFAYNVKGWRASTLIRLVNQGDFDGAAEEFPKWTHAAGKVLPGLVKRRDAERELFLA